MAQPVAFCGGKHVMFCANPPSTPAHAENQGFPEHSTGRNTADAGGWGWRVPKAGYLAHGLARACSAFSAQSAANWHGRSMCC